MEKIKILIFSLMALVCSIGMISCQEKEFDPAELLVGKWSRTMGYEIVIFPDGNSSETEVNDAGDTYQLIFYQNGNGESLFMEDGNWNRSATFRWASDGNVLFTLDNDTGIEQEGKITLLNESSLVVEEDFESEGNRVCRKNTYRRVE